MAHVSRCAPALIFELKLSVFSPAHMQFLIMISEEYLQILTRFMAKAWQLDLDEIVCDFVQDHEHKLSVPVPTF